MCLISRSYSFSQSCHLTILLWLSSFCKTFSNTWWSVYNLTEYENSFISYQTSFRHFNTESASYLIVWYWVLMKTNWNDRNITICSCSHVSAEIHDSAETFYSWNNTSFTLIFEASAARWYCCSLFSFETHVVSMIILMTLKTFCCSDSQQNFTLFLIFWCHLFHVISMTVLMIT